MQQRAAEDAHDNVPGVTRFLQERAADAHDDVLGVKRLLQERAEDVDDMPGVTCFLQERVAEDAHDDVPVFAGFLQERAADAHVAGPVWPSSSYCPGFPCSLQHRTVNAHDAASCNSEQLMLRMLAGLVFGMHSRR